METERNNYSLAFFGTSPFAVYVLEEMEVAGILPDVVVTVPDKPAGRGLKVVPSPAKVWALERDIPVLEPRSWTEGGDGVDVMINTEWDIFVVASYGKIIPRHILDLPRRGSLNVHPSLLPKFRGPSPVESQILENERETGVTIMLLDEEVDHGPIVAQASITPEAWPLRRTLLKELLGREGGRLLVEALPPWLAGEFEAEEQDHTKATFTKKIEKEDGELSLTDEPYANYLKFCAFEGWPGTYFFIEKNGKQIRVKITDAEFTGDEFRILRVIPEGKKEMLYADFLKGLR